MIDVVLKVLSVPLAAWTLIFMDTIATLKVINQIFNKLGKYYLSEACIMLVVNNLGRFHYFMSNSFYSCIECQHFCVHFLWGGLVILIWICFCSWPVFYKLLIIKCGTMGTCFWLYIMSKGLIHFNTLKSH